MAKRVWVERYERAALAPGDQCYVGDALVDVSSQQATQSGDVSQTLTAHLLVRPGRTGGLGSHFWGLATWANFTFEGDGEPAWDSGRAIALTRGAGVIARYVSIGSPPVVLSGLTISVPGGASVFPRDGSGLSELATRLPVAGALDGGLSAAGAYLQAHCQDEPTSARPAGRDLWLDLVHIHLQMARTDASVQVMDRVEPSWDQALTGLDVVIADLLTARPD